LYLYVGLDPFNRTDPTGLTPQEAADWAASMAEAHPNSSSGTGYSLYDANRNVGGRTGAFLGGRLAPKCNFFVFDALRAGSVAPSRINGAVPRAADWFNPNVGISNYRMVQPDEELQPGDVLSNGSHVGIYQGTGQTTSAATPDSSSGDRIVTNDWGQRTNSNGQPSEIVRARRYVEPPMKTIPTDYPLQKNRFDTSGIGSIGNGTRVRKSK